jgi:hypothetical protein
VLGVLWACPALAQRSPVPVGPGTPACAIIGEAIVNLSPPFFGSPAIWDATFGGKDNLVQFSAALALSNGNVLASGETLDKGFKPQDQIMIELNRRARAVDDKRMPARMNERSSGMVATDKGYVISSTFFAGKRNTEKWVRLAWYDAERQFVRDMVLKDPAFDYESMGLTRAVDGRGFLALVYAAARNDPNDQYGMLFRIDNSGRLIWKRAYRPGIANQIYGINVVDKAHYITSGRIRNEDGRMAGWIMKLNDDGTIIWQNTYPRGNYAVLRHGYIKQADGQSGDHYVLTGQVMPIGGDPGAAWVIEVDPTGGPVWQRYFRAAGYDLDGRSVQVNSDSRITVMANAKVVDNAEGQQSHIRLFTLSPRGGLMEDESYLEGHSTTGSEMIVGMQDPWNGERIVTAMVQKGGKVADDQKKVELITDALVRQEKEKSMANAEGVFGPPGPTPEQAAMIAQSMPEEIYHQGWVFVATALDPYTDPCVMKEADPAQ